MSTAIVADASSWLVPAAQAVLRALAARSSGSPDADWVAFLEGDLRSLVARDPALAELLGGFGWSGGEGDGKFASPPALEELRCALPVFTRRSQIDTSAERQDFERRVTKFINKVSPQNAQQEAEKFGSSGLWSEGEERAWRLHAFAALMLRSFARLARYRPAKGNLFLDMSILGTQVGAVCELIRCTPGLRGAIDLWVLRLLGAQRLWAPRRLAICAAHAQAAQMEEGLGLLPDFLLRRAMDFIYPETSQRQVEVAGVLPPHAERTEVAIILGHLLWSCPHQLWQDWAPVGLDVVEALLSSDGAAAEAHHAGIVLFALCGRLQKDPLAGIGVRAAAFGLRLQALALPPPRLEGFVRHRITCAVEAAAELAQKQSSVLTRPGVA